LSTDKTMSSKIDARYEEMKKLMVDLNEITNFDSVIVDQPQVIKEPTISNSIQQNYTVNQPRWKFILENNLLTEHKKLLKVI